MNVLFVLSLKWLNGPVKSKVMLRRSVTWPQSPGQASRKQFTSIVCPSLQLAENLFFLNQQTKKKSLHNVPGTTVYAGVVQV